MLTYPQHSGERYRTNGPLVELFLYDLEYTQQPTTVHAYVSNEVGRSSFAVIKWHFG